MQTTSPETLERATALLARLVAFPSVSSAANLPLIEWVAEELRRSGVEAQILPSPDQEGKANLIATLGPQKEGGVVLSGHTDVVPVSDQAWESDPFVLTEKDGKLYARGTCDMKGFLASVLAVVPSVVASKLRRPIHLVLTYDEEVGCFGAPHAIRALLEKNATPSCVVVGEPSMMKPISGHKAIAIYETRVEGFAGHSCDIRQGVSAVMAAARLVAKLGEMQTEEQQQQDDRFDPPWTSVHVGVIKGGTAVNIIAPSCSFLWDLRALPEGDEQALPRAFAAWHQEHILPAMRAVHEGCSIETHSRAVVPPLNPEVDSPAERLVRKLTGDNRHRYVSYVTEAGQYQRAGISAIVCGPGSIDQAHKANEFLEKDQLAQSCSFIEKIVADCCEV